jgi:hypothetical protein
VNKCDVWRNRASKSKEIATLAANWLGAEAHQIARDGNTFTHDRERRKEVLARLCSQLRKNASGSSLLSHTSCCSFIRVQG